jgi:hypothetical protein
MAHLDALDQPIVRSAAQNFHALALGLAERLSPANFLRRPKVKTGSELAGGV